MPLSRLLKSIRPSRRSGVVLELDLTRGVRSASPGNLIDALKAVNEPSMRSIAEGLRKGATDDRVKGLVVHVGTAPLTVAQSDELAGLIRKFGEHKPTVAFAESFGEFGSAIFAYKIAAAASDIWLQPSGMLTIGGLHLDITLMRGLLSKLGIEPQFGQRHEYKTAADRFAADEVTDASREMTTRIGQSLLDEAAASIARDRDLSLDAVWAAVNTSPLTPEQAEEAGLIDNIGYRDEAFAAVHAAWGTTPEDQLFVHRYVDGRRFAGAIPDPRKKAVAVVSIRGNIVLGRGHRGRFVQQSSGSDEVCEMLRSVTRDERVKAVVLVVDSPGGSYVASDTIRRAVLRVRESGRPVVAVMGDVAASGGYFVSMAADEILAQPSTLTGSIGVLAGKMVTRELYEKIGLKREGIDIGERAGMLSSGRTFTAEEWAVLDAELDRIYADFTAKAAADRGQDLDQLEPNARGRVWSGADAKDRGLIDHLGGIEDAVDRACVLADLDRSAIQLKSTDELGLLAQFVPARNSESASGSARVGVPASTDDLMAVAAQVLGIQMPGVLSLPFVPKVTG